jgi:hypothetical protein
MRNSAAAIVVLAAIVSLTGCGGGSTKAGRDCFDVWNADSNQTRQSAVAGHFTVANVSRWRAVASGGANLGGPASQGCGYLFHTSKRYLSISGAWKGETIRWGLPPSQHGSWSSQQEASVRDNATVDAGGLLGRR